MTAVSRLGDMSTGHSDWGPRASDSASGDVFANGIGIHRIGDHWPTHCNSIGACHDAVDAKGSSSVFANGKAVGRIGDDISCGDLIAAGSSNVFAGG